MPSIDHESRMLFFGERPGLVVALRALGGVTACEVSWWTRLVTHAASLLSAAAAS